MFVFHLIKNTNICGRSLTLCPWCLPYSLQTQHMRGPDWQASSRQTNSMAWTWCCGHSIFSWGLSASGTRRCLASVRVEWVSWEHSAHRCVAHTVQYMDAVWLSSSSQRIIHWGTGERRWLDFVFFFFSLKCVEVFPPYFSHAFQSVLGQAGLVARSILEALQEFQQSKVLL